MNFNLSIVDESNSPLVVDEIIVNGNSTLAASSASEVITNNSSFDISVTLSGYHPYTNSVTIYTEDETVVIKLFPIVTNTSDPNYRRPYPSFFVIIEPCSYNAHLYNASSHPFGLINYYENGTLFSSGNDNATFSTCQADILSFTQEVIVREIPNCGGTSPVIWTESTVATSTTVTEYKPQLTLNRAFECCETLDEEITIYPISLELQDGTIHDSCDIVNAVSTVLEYTVLNPDGTTLATASYIGTDVNPSDLSTLSVSFTPTQLGTHTITASVSNCCTTVDYNFTFDSCYSWVVTNTTCNIIQLQNLSSSTNLTYTLKKFTDYNSFDIVTLNTVLQQNIVVTPGQTLSLDLVDDNLYTITIADSHPSTVDKEYFFLLDCGIKECKKDMLLDLLCENLAECDKVGRLEKLAEFAEFKALEEIVYKKWDEWKYQQSLVEVFSVNDVMEDVITLSKAIKAMKKICDTCTEIEEDCGCK